MYYLAAGIGVSYFTLLVLSRKKNFNGIRKGIIGLFDRMAYLLFDWVRGLKKKFGHSYNERASPQLTKDLEQLYPGEDVENVRAIYIIKKLSMSLMIFLLGTIIAVCVKYTENQELNRYSSGEISRAEYYGDSEELLLKTSLDKTTEPISVTIHPRKLNEEEIENLLPEFYMNLEKQMLGDNPSTSEVYLDLNLSEEVEGYPFSVEWTSSNPSIVSAGSGIINKLEERINITLKAVISYEEYEYETEYELTLVPEPLSEEEAFHNSLAKLLSDSEKENRGNTTWVLPTEIDGRQIDWESAGQQISKYVFVGMLIISLAIFFISDKDLSKQVEEKKKRMKRAYPDVVQKLALFVGAGMTVRSAFEKIANDAANLKNSNPVYSEMLFACREIRSGVSESEAYERFGRRTSLQEYIRMSALLGQNLRKGSSNLLERLREEAEIACTERIQSCRRIGEEASTKLLIPMVLMLVVVMVIIMLPAFLSMGV